MSIATVPLLLVLFAQATTTPAVQVDPPATAELSPWQRRYDQAREDLRAGRFAEAAAHFESLAGTAPDPGRELAALEQANLARFWSQGGFRLIPPGGGSRPDDGPGALLDRRTTDELAVLYTGALLYGIGSGIVLATYTDPDSPAGGILPALGFAGLSVGLVAYLDRALPFRYGVPQSIVSGLFIGLEQGVVWSWWNEARRGNDEAGDGWSASTISTVIWGASTAGAIAGGLLGSAFGATPGKASLTGSAAVWSAVIAGFTTGAIAPDNDNRDNRSLFAAAVALNVGGVAGAMLAHQTSPSIARVRFVDLGGIAGGLLFGGLYWAAAGDGADDRGVLTALALGTTAGLATAWWLTSDLPEDPGRSRQLQSRWVPLLAPTPQGAGMILGVGGVM